MKNVDLYTDGACSYNPGPGGWGVVLKYGKVLKEFSGYSPNTTNNQMELTAVIEGLKKLNQKCKVTIYTDSAYVLNAFEQDWLQNWQLNNWKNANKKPVQNKDLWEELLLLTAKHAVSWVKVKGHSDNVLNNKCDQLARNEIVKNNKPTAPTTV